MLLVRKRKTKINFDQILENMLTKLEKTIENLSFKELVEVIPMLFAMYYGYKSMENINPMLGAAVGITGYKLAQSMGEASSIAGVAVLVSLGLVGVTVDQLQAQQQQIKDIQNDPNLTEEQKRQMILALIAEWQT